MRDKKMVIGTSRAAATPPELPQPFYPRAAPRGIVPDADSFEAALRTYGSLMLEEPDVEGARRVEEVQLGIMREASGRIDPSMELGDVLGEMEDDGFLGRAIGEVARELGGTAPADPLDAYRRAMGGDLDDADARSALIAVQAVARAYAEKYESINGAVEGGDACPLCGTESVTMVREGRGYFMVCPLCGYRWIVSEGSPACPRCGEEEKLGVFADRGGTLGLAACQSCGFTWHMILGDVDAPRIVLPLI